jgi:hypothetical protein
MSLKKRINDDYQGRSNRQIVTSEQISHWAYVGIIIIMLVLIATSCLPNRKFAKAVKIMNDQPDQAAWYCAVKFPVKDTVIYRDSITYDTIVNTNYFSDTTTIHDTTTITSPAKTLVKTVYKVKEIVRENTAKVQALEYALTESTKIISKKDSEVDECREKSNEWEKLAKKRFWWLLLLIAAVAGWILRKPLMKIIKPI